MLTSVGNTTKIRCDWCGKFIHPQDVMNKTAYHFLTYPDSEFSEETYESKCSECVRTK